MRQQKIPDRLCNSSIDKYVKHFHELAEAQTQQRLVAAEKVCEVARHICNANGALGAHHVSKLKELLSEWDSAKK